MPTFFEDDDISGWVEIDLDKAESIKSVTISVSFDDFAAPTPLQMILRLSISIYRSRQEPLSSAKTKTFF